MNGVKIGVISLGCSKNRVDTELMLGELQKAGYSFTEEPAEAEVILINTCGFIESAKQESIDTILEMAEYKKAGSLKALVVTGCLSGRYRDELAEQMPEVDAFLGVTAQKDIVQAVGDALRGKRTSLFKEADVSAEYAARILTTPRSYAYIKIAEGCNNRCAYCAIPYIRGNLQSRPMEEICEEARFLLQKDVSELILVAQDTGKYGADLYRKPCLPELMDRLAVLPGLRRLRLLYCYPDGITEELLETFCRRDAIAKYLDMPIQHVDNAVLKHMNRKDTKETIYATVKKIRAKSEDFILRTTLIVGFPGENEAQFAALERGVEELAFDRLGCFPYSREEGTPAYNMPDQIPEEVKIKRAERIMRLQRKISRKANERRIGRVYRVLIEGFLPEKNMYVGRSYGEAPDVDGAILVTSDKPLEIGCFQDVVIKNAGDYELYGRNIKE